MLSALDVKESATITLNNTSDGENAGFVPASAFPNPAITAYADTYFLGIVWPIRFDFHGAVIPCRLCEFE